MTRLLCLAAPLALLLAACSDNPRPGNNVGTDGGSDAGPPLPFISDPLRADAGCDWPQWGQNWAHTGQSCVSAQGLGHALATVTFDPFVPQEIEEAAGLFGADDLFVHYASPLIVGEDLYIAVKSGTYVSCVPPGSLRSLPLRVRRLEPADLDRQAPRVGLRGADRTAIIWQQLEAPAAAGGAVLGTGVPARRSRSGGLDSRRRRNGDPRGPPARKPEGRQSVHRHQPEPIRHWPAGGRFRRHAALQRRRARLGVPDHRGREGLSGARASDGHTDHGPVPELRRRRARGDRPVSDLVRCGDDSGPLPGHGSRADDRVRLAAPGLQLRASDRSRRSDLRGEPRPLRPERFVHRGAQLRSDAAVDLPDAGAPLRRVRCARHQLPAGRSARRRPLDRAQAQRVGERSGLLGSGGAPRWRGAVRGPHLVQRWARAPGQGRPGRKADGHLRLRLGRHARGLATRRHVLDHHQGQPLPDHPRAKVRTT